MWSLYNEKKFLDPLKFTNGKTQQDVVEEVLDAIKQGHKIIFIRGVCGTGKSGIALNVAKELGKSSIVVPVKYLQSQYERDYTRKFYIKKDNNEKLKIRMITGRNNHQCKFKVGMADDRLLPCTIEIRKDNLETIKKFLEMNNRVDENDFEKIEDVRRLSVAPACEYWSPVVPEDVAIGWNMKDAEKIEYDAVGGNKFVMLKRNGGCSYYNQFENYKEADVVIFNSRKYEIENLLKRKPETEVEIIDECDEFLDSLGNERSLNLDFYINKINSLLAKDGKWKDVLMELNDRLIGLMRVKDDEKIHKINETGVVELFSFLMTNYYLGEIEELENLFEVMLAFQNYLDDTYVKFELNKREQHMIRIVNVNLKKKLDELLNLNKVFVFMSGTIHSKKVLREIFGINEFVVVNAEVKEIGKVKRVFTGKERDFRYRYFEEGRYTREDYLRALNKVLDRAIKPVLVHVNSFSDLPSEEEKEKFGLTLMSQERLLDLQERYKNGELMHMFKDGKIDVLYSTKCNRGVDFPGEMCRSIVFTKYPYPSMNSLFWKVLKKSKPDEFLDFYFDKAFREFKQRMFRGLRSEDDEIFLLSPDLKVLR